MARIKSIDKSEPYAALQAQASSFNESKDCSVVAIAAVCGLTYEKAHALAAQFGRKPGKGMHVTTIKAAIRATGRELVMRHAYEFIQRYPVAHQVLKSVTTHHPDRFSAIWQDGKSYLLFTANHVCAIVNGTNCDWTRGKAMRATFIYEVLDAGGQS